MLLAEKVKCLSVTPGISGSMLWKAFLRVAFIPRQASSLWWQRSSPELQAWVLPAKYAHSYRIVFMSFNNGSSKCAGADRLDPSLNPPQWPLGQNPQPGWSWSYALVPGLESAPVEPHGLRDLKAGFPKEIKGGVSTRGKWMQGSQTLPTAYVELPLVECGRELELG